MKQYSRPGLIEFGRVGALTLGTGGTLPDLIGVTTVSNSNCPTAVNTDGTTRVACINAS